MRQWLARRGFRRALTTLGLMCSFVLSLGLGVALHTNLPLTRRFAARLASEVLSDLIVGTVEVGPPSEITPLRVRVPHATLLDGEGRRVLALHDVRMDFRLLGLVLDAVLGNRIAVFMRHVRIERAQVELVADAKTGEPTISLAMAPRVRGSAARDGAGSEDGTQVSLPHVEIGTVSARAELYGQPPLEAEVQRVQGELSATPKQLTVAVRSFWASLRAFGEKAEGTGNLSVQTPGSTRANFHAFVNDIELPSEVLFDGSRLKLTATVPGAAPEAVRKVIPSWPLRERISGKVVLEGELPNLELTASLAAGTSKIELAGPVVARAPESADLDLHLTHFDARALLAEAPPTDLSARGKLSAHREPRPTLDLVAQTEPTQILGQDVPTLHLAGHFDETLTATVTADEPGMPFAAEVKVSAEGEVDVDARSSGLDLSRFTRVPLWGASGKGDARVQAHLAGGELHAKAEATLERLSATSVRAGRAVVRIDVNGPMNELERLRGTASLEATDVTARGHELERATVLLEGDRFEPSFKVNTSRSDGATLEATGVAELAGAHAGLRGVRLIARKDGISIEGDVATLDLERGLVDIPRLEVKGAGGDVTGAARLAPTHLRVTAEAKEDGVNLDLLARALGLSPGTLGGQANFNVDLEARGDLTTGHIEANLKEVTAAGLPGLSAALEADFEGTTFKGGIKSGTVTGLGSFAAKVEGSLGGPALEAGSYARATYRADVQVDDLTLGALLLALPRDGPLRSLDGKGAVHLLVEKATAEAPLPRVFATVRTTGLNLRLQRSPDTPPRSVADLDLTLTGAFDGTTGAASGTTVVTDTHGHFLSATGNTHVDPTRLLRDPLAVLSEFPSAPILAVVTLPSRRIELLPEEVRPRGMQGFVAASLAVRGSLDHPTLHGNVAGSGLGVEGADTSQLADVRVEGHYDWTSHAVGARAWAEVGDVRVASITGNAVLPDGDPARWVGGAHLDLSGLPFSLLGSFAPSRVSGQIHGQAELRRSDTGGAVGGDLSIRDARVEGLPIGEGNVKVSTIANVVSARLGFRDESGRIDADGSIPMDFTGALPALRDGAAARGRLVARRFRAAGLAPLLKGVLSRVGGRVNADLTATLSPPRSRSGDATWTGSIRGSAGVEGGSALIDALGLEVRDVSFNAAARPDGKETILTVSNIKGRVRSNRQNVRGSATLVLDGVRVVRGAATLLADDMPVLLRGAPQGRITGSASARLAREPGRMRVAVQIPRLTVKLPQSSARDVIDLGDNPDVRILQLAAGAEDTSDDLPWHLVTELGDVTVERRDVLLGIEGTPVIDLGKEAVVSGEIRLSSGGRIPVLGKVFIIEQGTVIFDTGETNNPRLDVTASYRAQGDAMIYVDVTGTLKSARLTLRSDPPLPEPEVFALLMGGGSPDTGTTDGSTDSGASAAGAMAIGGSVGALGLNELLSDSPVELRVDTTAESRPRYTAAVRLQQNLWFEASTYQQSGQGIDGQTDRSIFSGTVDYRFTRRWSLRTEVGTSGGALDLLWQYRY